MTTTDPTSVYANRFYEMDPEFDDLLRGDQLRDGMVVLLQEWVLRGDPERAATGDRFEAARCRETARWCTVTDLRLLPVAGVGVLVEFLGAYTDGTKYPRKYNESYYWIVKRDSIEASS